MRRKILGAFLLFGAAMTLTATALVQSDEKSRFLEDRAELVIRKIGHDLLLHAGDSTSRVLPVKRLREDVFQLEFENRFSFVPDSLVQIVQRSLAEGELPLSYLVSVLECSKLQMVYGFEARPTAQTMQPCLGRIQPLGCYSIRIAFTEPVNPADSPNTYYYGKVGLIGITLLAFILLILPRKVIDVENSSSEKVTIVGALEFQETSGFLKRGNRLIQLSGKESKLLKILASHANQLVEREKLQNEIWASDGVITSRSLDMFVSKLRKKLSDDPSIRIVNIHGRGYRLEVGE